MIYSALINKQVYYEQHNRLVGEGFFYSKIADLEESTTLTKRQQSAVIKALIDAGLIECKRCGMPAKRYFRVRDDVKLLDDLLKQGEAIMNELNPIAQKCENVTSYSDKIVQQEVTNCNIKLAQNLPYTSATFAPTSLPRFTTLRQQWTLISNHLLITICMGVRELSERILFQI